MDALERVPVEGVTMEDIKACQVCASALCCWTLYLLWAGVSLT